MAYEVWQGSTLICSRSMKLTKREAEDKVANEARLGNRMEVRIAGPEPKPYSYAILDYDDD